MEGSALVAGFPAQMNNWRAFYWEIFSISTTAPKWSHANFIFYLLFLNYFPIFGIHLSLFID